MLFDVFSVEVCECSSLQVKECNFSTINAHKSIESRSFDLLEGEEKRKQQR